MDDNLKDRVTDVGASACAIPNAEAPFPHFKALYGSTRVPHPTNSSAKIVEPAKVMEQVLSAK